MKNISTDRHTLQSGSHKIEQTDMTLFHSSQEHISHKWNTEIALNRSNESKYERK